MMADASHGNGFTEPGRDEAPSGVTERRFSFDVL